MPTIQDNTARTALLQRMHELTPESPASFGTLNAPRMLCHLQDQIRVALGTTPCRARKSVYRFRPLRWLVLKLPIPKGKLSTVKEMVATEPATWEADLALLEELLVQLSQASSTAPHPVFGPMTATGWCELTWKHFDHHFAQFGV